MGDRHGGRFARRGRALNPPHPQVDAPHGESLPTRRTSERICPHARTLSSAKASRHGARAKEFAPRRNALLGEGFPTRRTSERVCPAREHAPRRRSPDTAHERKDLPPRRNTPLGESLPTRRTSERICPAGQRSPRRRPPDTAHERKGLPRGVRVCPTCRRTAGRPRSTDSQKNTPSAGSHPQRARPLPSSFTKKNKTTP